MILNIDPSHSNVEFAVKHMSISTVRGRFGKVEGTVELANDGSLKALNATIDAQSIDTNEANRDNHLRSADFFNTETNPHLTFNSTNVEKKGGDSYRVTGDLSMNGHTKSVTFEVETTAPITDPWGNQRAAGTATGKLNRKDWGLTWNQVLELGALLVSEEVRFTLDVQAVVPQPVAA